MARDAAPLEPDQVDRLRPAEADELLGGLESTVPRRAPLVDLPAGIARTVFVFGDSHGDWRSTQEVVRRFHAVREEACLVGLGDYLDRAPPDCGVGAVANALYLLGQAAANPERVFLIQGNHETTRRIGARPHTLRDEVAHLWGPDPERYRRIMGLLERGPLAVSAPSGVYLAHAGFPRSTRGDWREEFRDIDEARLLEITWAECAASRLRRGAAPPWDEPALAEFFARSGHRLFLRGHDPDLNGRPVYGGRALTLHTSRTYEKYGGVLLGSFRMDQPVRSTDDVTVSHLPTEGKTFGGSSPSVPSSDL